MKKLFPFILLSYLLALATCNKEEIIIEEEEETIHLTKLPIDTSIIEGVNYQHLNIISELPMNGSTKDSIFLDLDQNNTLDIKILLDAQNSIKHQNFRFNFRLELLNAGIFIVGQPKKDTICRWEKYYFTSDGTETWVEIGHYNLVNFERYDTLIYQNEIPHFDVKQLDIGDTISTDLSFDNPDIGLYLVHYRSYDDWIYLYRIVERFRWGDWVPWFIPERDMGYIGFKIIQPGKTILGWIHIAFDVDKFVVKTVATIDLE